MVEKNSLFIQTQGETRHCWNRNLGCIKVVSFGKAWSHRDSTIDSYVGIEISQRHCCFREEGGGSDDVQSAKNMNNTEVLFATPNKIRLQGQLMLVLLCECMCLIQFSHSLSSVQLAGGVVLGVALWLRHDSHTSSLLELKFDGHQAPTTFLNSKYFNSPSLSSDYTVPCI